ncbi:MAG: fibronectin type III domain-containing protein [Bacteroidota bacterium]
MEKASCTNLKITNRSNRNLISVFVLFIMQIIFVSSINANTNKIKNNNPVPIPAGKAIVSSEIYEAEDNFVVVNDVANPNNNNFNSLISVFSIEAASGNSAVSIPDPSDRIRIEFEITEQSDYVINIRLRSGDRFIPTSFVDNPSKYSISLDNIEIPFTFNSSSTSDFSPSIGGSFWGVLESDNVLTALAVGTYALDIELTGSGFFGFVDYVEIVKIADEGSFQPITPSKVNNLNALVRGNASVDIAWDPVPTADNYELIFSVDNGPFAPLETNDKFDFYYSHTGLTPETNYSYSVRALTNGAPEEGEWSDTVTVMTRAVPSDLIEVNHVATFGDDLALSSTPDRGAGSRNFIFDTGVFDENGTDLITMPTGGAGGMSFTPAYHFNGILTTELGFADDYDRYEILSTISGLSNGKIADISKNSVTYDKLLAQIAQGQQIATDKSLSYSFRAINFLQGNADVGTDTATYKTALDQLVNDLNSDLNTTLSTTGVDYPIFLVQSIDPAIAVAQYNASKINKNINISTPSYFAEDTDFGREILAQYLAKTYKDISFDQEAWTPVSPKNIVKNTNTVTVEFNVIAEPLVLDESTVVNPGSFGFELFDIDGQINITDVAISDGNKVIITTDRNIGENAKILYAASNSSPRGNLRDSDNQSATFDNTSLYNWAIAFEESIMENIAPEAPTELAAIAISESQINVSWNAPGSTFTGYILESALTNEEAAFSELATLTAEDTTFSHTDIDPATVVFYRIKAINQDAESAYSNVVSATTAAIPLEVPTNLTATVVSSNQIDLSWNSPASTITGYILESALSNEEAEYSQLVELSAEDTTFSHTGISPETTVFYRVKAINENFESGYSNVASGTTTASLLGSPTELVATDSTTSEITISWTAGTGDILEYVIQSSMINNANGFTTLDTVDVNTTTFTQTGLSPDTTIFYRVFAINASASSDFSNILRASTLPDIPIPAVPGNFVAVASTTDINVVNLSWDVVTENVDGYVIEEATSVNGPYTQITALGATETSFVRTVPAAGTYFYRIQATNGAVASDFSTAQSVVTSIDEALSFGQFNVFPNPTNGPFGIEISAPKKENGKIKVFNTSGKVVFENTISSNFAGRFNIGNIESGLYLIEVKTKSYHQVRKLLIN